MKSMPEPGTETNHCVPTPPDLCEQVVKHFKPSGRILEPCCGDGNFLAALPPGTEWCEILRGRDFFDYSEKVDWIVTNPPWDIYRDFMDHAMDLSDNIVFVITIAHAFTKRRLKDMRAANFGIHTILLLEKPYKYPSGGLQLAAIYWKRGHRGHIRNYDYLLKD